MGYIEKFFDFRMRAIRLWRGCNPILTLIQRGNGRIGLMLLISIGAVWQLLDFTSRFNKQ